jgi:alpha-mannosidase
VERNGPVKIAVKETGPLIASLLVECDAPGCHRLTREYRLHALRNYLEIIDTVDKQAVRTKEGVHFGFGFQVPDGTVRMDVPWGVVRPELDQIPGACKNWFTVQRYVDISNQDFGVTLLTPDAPLMQFGGITANLIGSLSDPKAWLDQLEPSCTVYSWAMNNHWHTNYRAEQEGPTTFRYVIWPHEHPDEIDRVAHHAMEYSQPVVVWPARGDFLAPRRFYLSGDVQCTAYKPSEDGKAVLIRLYGGSGEDQSVAIQWDPIKPAKLWLSDNSEEPREEVSGAISVPAWSVVTLRAEFAE